MNLEMTGFFETENGESDKFIKNAIAILYPYVRALISTYTANANINPLILPAINVNKLIENSEDKKDQKVLFLVAKIKKKSNIKNVYKS